MNATADSPAPYRVGEWLPSDQTYLDQWLAAMIQKTHTEQKTFHPLIVEFQELIESEAPTGKPQVRDYPHMLQLLNTVMTHAPEYDQTGLVGCPINTSIDACLRTGIAIDDEEHTEGISALGTGFIDPMGRAVAVHSRAHGALQAHTSSPYCPVASGPRPDPQIIGRQLTACRLALAGVGPCFNDDRGLNPIVEARI